MKEYIKVLTITLTALLFPSSIFASDWWLLNGGNYECIITKPTPEEELTSGRCTIDSINDSVGRLSLNCDGAIFAYFTTERVCLELAEALKQRYKE